MEGKKKKPRTERLSGHTMLRRISFLLVIFGVMVFLPLLWQLWQLQIVQHDELEQKAIRQQTSSWSLSASRGTIYDCNGNVLAISSTAYDVVISPLAITELQETMDQKKASAIEKAATQSTIDEYDVDVRQLVVDGMAELLGLDREELERKCDDTTSQYKRLAQKVDTDTEEKIRAYIDEHGLTGCIYLQANSKRYYPYSTLASQIIGFTNDNGGAYGLEATFDSVLTGTEGLVVTAKDSKGTDLLNFFQDYYDAEDGSDLHLTLDANIQTLCESYLAEAVEKYYVQNGGFIIVMECDTGAVVGMASSPNYDLNNYTTVIDSTLLDGLEESAQTFIEAGEDADTAQQMAYSAAINTMWRNKAINDTYEPGSTFKTLVLAAALEEGVTYDGDSFYCSGSIHVADRDISCSNTSGHGAQDLATAVGHSCNPAFITLGQRLGTEKFYEYLEAFGILDSDWQGTSTGIDLPGESKSIVWDYDDFSIVNLATASFGQRLQVTPIQLIAAANAVVNGGYYYQPYVVDYVEDANGNVTYSADTTPLRQVISESTSETCREMLEGVVGNGLTGKNAYRAGYRIGGKTGTSQILGTDKDYVVSFLGFAPADDPKYIVLVALDTPENVGTRAYPHTPNDDYISGGNMAAPIAGDLLVDILDYASYGKQYTSDELTGADTVVPYLTGYDLATAQQICTEKGFTYRVVGSGDDSSVVQYQTAQGGTSIPSGNELVLYIGEATPPETVTMPDLTGMDPTQATEELATMGLYMKATGASKYYGSSTKVYSQSVEAGTAVTPGTVITVAFNDTSDTENDGDVLD